MYSVSTITLNTAPVLTNHTHTHKHTITHTNTLLHTPHNHIHTRVLPGAAPSLPCAGCSWSWLCTW